jgi:hypothetical protein
MWRQLRLRRPRIRWRSAVAAVALLGQVTTAFGVPLPALPRARDFSRPFPCMDHPCGCHDADECWAGCCCLSDAEKLAWCEAKSVEPPSFVRRNAERELAQSKKKKCCCCEDGNCAEHGDQAKPDAESKLRWVLGFVAARCHHHGPAGLMTTAPGLPPAAPKSAIHEPIPAEPWTLGDIVPCSTSTTPVDPPPRIV